MTHMALVFSLAIKADCLPLRQAGSCNQNDDTDNKNSAHAAVIRARGKTTMPKLPVLMFAAALLATALPAVSHHSVWAEFDNNRPMELRGRFVEMDWVNPHSWVHLEVTAEDGTTTVWAAETPPPNQLIRLGWRRSDLKVGDEIVVNGFAAKNGQPRLWARDVKLLATGGETLPEPRTEMALFDPNPNGIPAGVLPGKK